MCFLLRFKREKRIQVFVNMKYGDFYDKYSSVFMPYTSKARFMRANRYRRLFTGDVIRSGDLIVIPKKLV
jgi:hypothetical protein